MAEVTIGSAAQVARTLVEQRGVDTETAFAFGWILHDLDARANSLNVMEADLSPIADELDMVIAKLTKAAERIKK